MSDYLLSLGVFSSCAAAGLIAGSVSWLAVGLVFIGATSTVVGLLERDREAGHE